MPGKPVCDGGACDARLPDRLARERAFRRGASNGFAILQTLDGPDESNLAKGDVPASGLAAIKSPPDPSPPKHDHPGDSRLKTTAS